MSHQDPVLETQKSIPTSRWATFIFSASLVAAAVCFLIIPPLLVLGIAFFIYRNLKDRVDRRGAGLASAAARISSISLIIGVVILLLPSSGGSRLSPRSTCAANLRGITQSMNVYAADSDSFPIVAFAPYATVPNAPSGKSTGTSDADAALRQLYTAHPGDVQACMWTLVLTGQVAPNQFICSEDKFAGTPAAIADNAGHYLDGFQHPNQLSYSLAYPWNADGKPGAWWKNTTDATLPLIADMTPQQGTGTPARNLTPPRIPADKRTWNSSNHMGDGQNVGYADGHAEFSRSPNIGHNNDSIYSMSASPSTGPAEFGGIPAGKTAPRLTADKPPYDIILLPVRNENTGAM